MNTRILGGIEFPKDLFQKLITNFAEGAAHTSLSCEKAFQKLEEYNAQLKSFLDPESETWFFKQSSFLQEEILNKLYFFILYSAHYQGVLPGVMSESSEDIKSSYQEHFSYFDSYLLKTIVLQNQQFDERATYKKVVQLFQVLPLRNACQKECQIMKKNHIDAFFYAISHDKIGILDIQKINEIINRDLDNSEVGFKKANNIIQGTSFSTTPKEYVPNELIKLLYQYENNFGDPSLSHVNIFAISKKEREDYFLKLCEREARFHISFERLHPFSDGNGRTGRILLWSNLLKQGLPPVFIPDIMLKQYHMYISQNDFKNFGQLLLICSFQELTRWISELRNYYKIDATEVEVLDQLSHKAI